MMVDAARITPAHLSSRQPWIKLKFRSMKRQLLVFTTVVAFFIMWLSHPRMDPPEQALPGTYSPWTKWLRSAPRPIPSESSSLSNSVHSDNEAKCQPIRNIVFLKTHKCASTTVQNILLRYGDRHDLVFVLPPNSNYLGHPKPFSRTMILKSTKGKYDILCHHMRFNQSEVEAIMPPDTVYITIVRDPASLYESLFSYYDIGKSYKKDLREVLKMPVAKRNSLPRFSDKFGRNQMSFDMGMDEAQFDNGTAVRNLISQVGRRFDFVMLSEKFDESLILLRHLLCWSLESILYFRQNTRLEKLRQPPLSFAAVQELRAWNAADQALYDHFSAEFERRIDRFGRQRLADEVKELRRWNDYWYDYCVQSKADSTKLEPKFRGWGGKVFGYKLKPDTHSRLCEDLAKAEIPFTNELREKQKRWNLHPYIQTVLKWFH